MQYKFFLAPLARPGEGLGVRVTKDIKISYEFWVNIFSRN